MHPRIRRLFLIDGLGACLSAAALGLLLAPRASWVGLPAPLLYGLGGIAGVFALYSLGCWRLLRGSGRPFLAGIAAANLAYALLTAGLVIRFRGQLTALGLVYFLLELAVLAVLVRAELRAAAA